MANGHCFAQGRALGSISRRKRRLFTPQRTLQIAVKNLTPDPENAWALHPLLLASFLNLGGCTSKLNLPWSYAKRRLAKFNGLTDAKFILHLKETECRFNHRNDNFASFIEHIFWGKL